MSKIEVNTVAPQCGTTLTLGESGDTVTLGTGASQSGFGRTGTVDWQTGSIKTGNFSATNGEGYFCNTTSGSFIMTLPAGSAGAIVSVQDYNNTFDSYSLQIAPASGEKINGGAGNIALDTEGEGLTLVYVDGTVGWRSIQDSAFGDIGSNYVSATGGTVTCCGDYKIHTFTGPGTLTVTGAGSPVGANTIEYMVVAGGGGGGASYGGGAGGGGFRFASPSASPLTYPGKPLAAPAALSAAAGSFPITVGGGGTGSTSNPAADAKKGSDSIFSTITSTGGGAGAYTIAGSGGGSPGGSGGGGSVSGSPAPGSSGAAGTGNTPPVSPAQGTNGGAAYCGGGYRSGGGGGAIVAGSPSPDGNAGGTGGDGAGMPTVFGSNGVPCGSFRYYAGGGGGGGHSGGGLPAAAGGKGGGGASSPAPGTAGVAGTTNSGGGGGGAGHPQPSNNTGGNGGSGIVVIRYKFQN